ncbi:MAG: Asp-tRNA(Asn)/Glu-tRNA(Gln) amidotransferase subunit GatC [Patescibacteria group bacterium]
MISKEEVAKIAKLARLELTETETEKMQKDLSSILDYFELLKKAPQNKNFKENFYHGAGFLRKDESRQSGLAKELLLALPDKKDDYVKVKAIL